MTTKPKTFARPPWKPGDLVTGTGSDDPSSFLFIPLFLIRSDPHDGYELWRVVYLCYDTMDDPEEDISPDQFGWLPRFKNNYKVISSPGEKKRNKV